jgi:hypothetical protein
MNNNLLNLRDERNQLFIASVIAVLCEQAPITIRLKDIEKYWSREIQRLQYDMILDVDNGTITFNLKEKTNEHSQSQESENH